MNERDDNDECGRDKCPHPADDRPCIELGKVKHVNAKHRSRPDADKEHGEKDAGNVGGDLGRSKLLYNNVERRSVMEVLNLFKI